MAWVLEISCNGSTYLSGAVAGWFHGDPARVWAELRGISALDIYLMADDGAHDPFNKDKVGPLLIAMLEFKNLDALMSARELIEQELSQLPAGVIATVTAMERKFYRIGQQPEPEPLSAPFSYVVRYHRPAEDEEAFIANYIATHPKTLAKLPEIRSIICYFPIETPPSKYSVADYMIGNEVAFDTVADFNAAMQSPVRQELRAHFHAFPKFSGLNTHFPMTRKRLVG